MAEARPPLTLTVLGAGPAWSDRPGSAGAAYLVRSGPEAVLLDLGHGAVPALLGAVLPEALHAIAISHLHPDHFIDLVPLRHYLCRDGGPTARLPVLAPDGLAERLEVVTGEPRFSERAYALATPSDAAVAAGPFTLRSVAVTHAPGSRAWRVTAGTGPGVVYTGDASDPAEIVPLMEPGDTLLAEATLGPGPVPAGTLHLDGPAVGRLAVAGRAGAVVVTHIRARLDTEATLAAVRARFPGPVALAVPGTTYAVGPGPRG
ncbi:MAG: MBL fold metallo-hydrolase [Chloroflexota bacterium]